MSNYKSLGREIQFILPILFSLILFFITNIIGLFDIHDLAYWSGKIYREPLRIFLYSFVHVDLNHLLSNLFGIVILRYSLIKLNSQNNKLFILLLLFIIPLQTIYLYILDNYFFYEYNNLLVGLSGVIYGSFSFLMMSSYFGKESLLHIYIGLKRNLEIFKLLSFLLSFGIIFSLLPGVSFNGHLGGIISGIIIFYISGK